MSELFYTIGKLSGFVGLLFLSILIISGDISRLLDRFFGLDKVIKFQRVFSYFTLLFVLGHPVFFMLSTKTVLPFLLPDFSFIPLAMGTISLYIFLLIMIASKLYKLISYRVWQYIHILTYILFALSLYHAINWGSESDLLMVKFIYGLLVLGFLAGVFYRLFYKIFRPRFNGEVISVSDENYNTFTLTLNINKKINHTPGQFCFLSLNRDRLYARHPFTIASAPNEQFLRFTIKNYGRFTKALRNLKVGDQITVEGPFGIFSSDLNDTRPLIMIAGGVGITPFMSMLRHLKSLNQIIPKVTLFYSVKTRADLLFESELNTLSSDWFDKTFIFSQESGRLTKDVLLQNVSEPLKARYYICGPIKMKEDTVKDLRSVGVSKNQIFFEDFFW